jgi:surfeit locus 1 family protein
MTGKRTLVALVAAGAALALAVSLGNWQLRRADEKLALQAQWDRAMQEAPVAVAGPDIASVAARLPLRVVLRGRFDFEHEIWLDNRQMDGRSGLMQVVPLQLADGAVVLVNRGFAARDPRDRQRLPEVARPTEEVTVEGLALAQTSRVLQIGENAPAVKGQAAIWQNLDFDAFERASGLVVARWVVQQTGGADEGLLRNWPVLSAGVEKHRGYAVQWYALAALIASLTLFFGARALRRRRSSNDSAHD